MSGVGRNQLSLGLDMPRQSRWRKSNRAVMHNLYFAVLPKRREAIRAADLTMALRDDHELLGQPVPPKRMHVTLAPIGIFMRLPEDIVFTALQIGGSISMAPFQTAFNRFVSFEHGEQCSLVLCCDEGNAELTALYQHLGSAIGDTGWTLNLPRRFTPHMTQLRGSSFARETPLCNPLMWTVEEFVLIHSLDGLGLHRYLGRWPLLN